jgi:hypothetical protein
MDTAAVTKMAAAMAAIKVPSTESNTNGDFGGIVGKTE